MIRGGPADVQPGSRLPCTSVQPASAQCSGIPHRGKCGCSAVEDAAYLRYLLPLPILRFYPSISLIQVLSSTTPETGSPKARCWFLTAVSVLEPKMPSIVTGLP